MQDRSPPARRRPLATHGRTIHSGQLKREADKEGLINPVANVPFLDIWLSALFGPAMNWADVATLRAQWRGTLVLKGVFHPEEAHMAADHGIDGVIVSHHSGRQLDGAPAALDALPAVVEAVAGRIPVLVDAASDVAAMLTATDQQRQTADRAGSRELRRGQHGFQHDRADRRRRARR
jgi:isopentenyl diphosphate isomerase/L-lactate dehydrogenase-like FMN-dependent dehydrogenase